MKRVLTGAVAFAIALLARPQLEAADFNRGDCNADGGYNIADAIYLLNHLFIDGAPGLQCDDACDLNDDGEIDLSDVVYHLFSLRCRERRHRLLRRTSWGAARIRRPMRSIVRRSVPVRRAGIGFTVSGGTTGKEGTS